MGYVGLPLSLRFAKAGIQVTGIDTDAAKVRELNAGRSYILHIPAGEIQEQVQAGRFAATSNFAAVAEADACLICVPTPLTPNREPDLSFILDSGKSMAPHLKKNILVVLESTTYPGTTDEELRPILEQGSGLTAGNDFHLAFCPEREDPGNPASASADLPRIIGGLTPACREKAQELYGKVFQRLVPVSSCRVAEAAKLLENIFRSVNIGLVNELKVTFLQMGIDIWEVIDAAKTKPFGFMPFYPGPGLGGHCVPIDPFYLTWKARQYGLHTRFIELAGEINTHMPEFVVSRIADALNDAGKCLRGSRILILGLAYKGNVDDDRESPSYALLDLLTAKGAKVDYNDPFVSEISNKHTRPHLIGKRSLPISNDYDAWVIATPHDAFRTLDYGTFGGPIIDTRNIVKTPHPRLYRA